MRSPPVEICGLVWIKKPLIFIRPCALTYKLQWFFSWKHARIPYDWLIHQESLFDGLTCTKPSISFLQITRMNRSSAWVTQFLQVFSSVFPSAHSRCGAASHELRFFFTEKRSFCDENLRYSFPLSQCLSPIPSIFVKICISAVDASMINEQKGRTSHCEVTAGHTLGFFGHRRKFFSNDRKKLLSFWADCLKI